ncbi:MAG: ABC transporter ATP-binding protein, partial [Rhodobiaceae bacterium]
RDVTDAPPSERGLSMVFQSYALFPHLSVEENIVFGLKVRKVPAADRANRLARVAEIVGLQEVLERKPGQLSGGQRQRQGCPLLVFTHDQAEAMSMGDKVILMRDGRIEQEGTPEELYERPMTTFAASFIGTPPMRLLNLVSGGGGMVIDGENSTVILEQTDRPMIVGVRPEHISISDSKGIPAELISADYLGSETMIDARIGGQPVLVRWPGQMRLTEPMTARLSWDSSHVHVFDAASGKREDNIKACTV